jgi:hypothetical protein
VTCDNIAALSWFKLNRHDDEDGGDSSESTEPQEGAGDSQHDDGQSQGENATSDDADKSESSEGEEPSKQEEPKTLAELLKLLEPDQRRIVQGEVSKARKEAQGLRGRLKTAEDKAAEYDQLLDAQKTEQQRAQEAAEARATTAEKQAAEHLAHRIRSEVKALAAEGFADPDDAAAFLDLSSYAGDNGEVDVDTMRADLDDLLVRKPHLAKPAAEPKPRAPAPNRAQGSSANGGEQASSFKLADKDAFAAELAKYRLKARS